MAKAIDIHTELEKKLRADENSSVSRLSATLGSVLEADHKEDLRKSARIKLLELTVKKQQAELQEKDEQIAGLKYELWANSADNYSPLTTCLLYTSPSPRDGLLSRMPSSA